jgi:LysM repeat protein
MNNPNPSPLIPQGSLVEQKNKGRARFKLAVFLVLSIHGIGLLALLMQSCAKAPEPTQEQTEQQTSNAAPAAAEQPGLASPPLTNNLTTFPAAPLTNTVPAGIEPSLATPTEYKVVANDKPVNIAKKFNISVQALMDANPGLEPTKLKIGQTLHIPAPTAAPAATGRAAGGVPPATETAAGSQIYTVKSGDNLTKIAGQFPGVTVRALRTANNLTTDQLKVGQKLKIPGKGATAAGTSAPAEAVPVVPPGAPGR